MHSLARSKLGALILTWHFWSVPGVKGSWSNLLFLCTVRSLDILLDTESGQLLVDSLTKDFYNLQKHISFQLTQIRGLRLKGGVGCITLGSTVLKRQMEQEGRWVRMEIKGQKH